MESAAGVILLFKGLLWLLAIIINETWNSEPECTRWQQLPRAADVGGLLVLEICGGVRSKNKKWRDRFGSCHLPPTPWNTCLVKLTSYADDFGPVPLAVGTTFSSGHMALQEAVSTLVAHYWVDVIVRALSTNQEGVIHGGRGSAEDCGGKKWDRTVRLDGLMEPCNKDTLLISHTWSLYWAADTLQY